MPIETGPVEPRAPTARLAPDAPRPSRRTLVIVGVVALAVAAVVVIAGVLGRSSHENDNQRWTQAQAIPVVSVVSPISDAGARTLTLPGTLQAWYAAQIYARVPGYVRAWYDDIGARVKAGQVLAVIDTPELDAQIVQARADLVSAQAAMRLADITARRWSGLLAQDAVSRQEADEKSGDFAVKSAQANAAKANLDRLLSLKAFSRIVAPFAGVVTARHTDIGALVNAGAGASSSGDLFEVSQIQPLRLYVDVPQVDTAAIQTGGSVDLTAPEHPGKRFAARFTTTSHAVSVKSGTLLAELTVDNAAGLLEPGEYVQVNFAVSPGAGAAPLRVPSGALLFRKDGPQLALLGPGDRVRVVDVGVGRDLGPTIEITRGLSASDKVIDNPPDSIVTGELVRLGASPARRGPGADAAG
jgi:RND family efflux transporter MFP subunit